ncbi:MAG: sigma-70 family RNA polymerase sigma factor [Deltaproteobacteria bacterium]
MTESPSARDPPKQLRRIPSTDTQSLADAPWREHYRCRVAAPKPAAQKPAPSELAGSNAPESNPTGSATGPTDSGALGSGAPGQPSESPSDPELVERMVRGDRSAVALLYGRHKLPLFALARGMLRGTAEAEDLLHDVFLEAWGRCADYSVERGSVGAWLMLRTRSRALDRIKAAGRRPAADHASMPDEPSTAHAPVETIDQARLRQLLVQMPEAQQQVVLLGYFEGLSSAEISERLQIPIGTVKSRTRAALESLRDVLGKGHD